MRSRREEYTKRFEELTKQEIKNYNDSLLATHMALEEFRGKLKGCVDSYAQQVANLSSQVKAIGAENIDLHDSIKFLKRKLESQRHDFNKLEREKIDTDRDHAKFQEWSKEEHRNNYGVIHELRESIADVSFNVNHKAQDLSQDIERKYQKTVSDNLKLKNEILSLPSEAKKVKEELLELSAAAAIDNAGIIKELDTVKRKSFVQEKMNEYFHIHLDRLKAKGKTPCPKQD